MKSISQTRKPRLREGREVAQRHTARKWQAWDSHPLHGILKLISQLLG